MNIVDYGANVRKNGERDSGIRMVLRFWLFVFLFFNYLDGDVNGGRFLLLSFFFALAFGLLACPSNKEIVKDNTNYKNKKEFNHRGELC